MSSSYRGVRPSPSPCSCLSPFADGSPMPTLVATPWPQGSALLPERSLDPSHSSSPSRLRSTDWSLDGLVRYGRSSHRIITNGLVDRPIGRTQHASLQPHAMETHAASGGRRTMRIVVIGGTGLIGSKTIPILRQGGHEAVAASPNTGVNTITGEGRSA